MRAPRRHEARAATLAAWAGFLTWLWLSGEVARYIGPRTLWVVAFGAISLWAAAVVHVASLRSARRASLSLGEAAGMAALLAPIVGVLVVPQPELGSLAASRRSSSGLAAAALAPGTGGPPSFVQIHYASQSPEYAARSGVSPGAHVELLGFVSSSTTEDSFELTRFYIACCAADAIPYSVVVTSARAREFAQDQWLEVSGSLAASGGELVVQAERITRRRAPRRPYLY